MGRAVAFEQAYKTSRLSEPGDKTRIHRRKHTEQRGQVRSRRASEQPYVIGENCSERLPQRVGKVRDRRTDLVDQPVSDAVDGTGHRVDMQVESLMLELDDFVDDERLGHAGKCRDQIPESTGGCCR